jgi:hypothetical protein
LERRLLCKLQDIKHFGNDFFKYAEMKKRETTVRLNFLEGPGWLRRDRHGVEYLELLMHKPRPIEIIGVCCFCNTPS